MSLREIRFCVRRLIELAALVVCTCGWGEVLYVGKTDFAGEPAAHGERRLASIQAAIDAAKNGDTVTVEPGKYEENISFKGKAITVRSEDPEDPAVVAATVIDGRAAGSVVTFNSSEVETSVLDGFTVTNGRAAFGGGIFCGSRATPTIRNNQIVGNTALQAGGGIYCSFSGYISRNIIRSNHSNVVGGGILTDISSWTVIRSNFIVKNTAVAGGGGIFCSSFCTARIINNTIADNFARDNGGGLYADFLATPETWNCIFWGNGDDLFGWGGNYLCVEDTGDENEGRGNIHANPRFVNPARGDYHLLASSPCIGAGTTMAPSMPVFDFDGERIPDAITADIGADEFLDTDGDHLADRWENKWFGNLSESAADDPDPDQLTNENEVVAGTDPTNPDTDGDSNLDGVEFFADTDPLDPESFFKIVRLSLSASKATLQWSTVPGRWYQTQYSDDFQSWTPVGQALRATGQNLSFTITITQSIRLRFFRVSVLP